MVPRFNNTGRNTPGDDRQLKKKLLDLEQKETYKRLRVNTMNKITKCLKESESYPKIENLHRIGEFFKGLELAGNYRLIDSETYLFLRRNRGLGARCRLQRKTHEFFCK